MHFLRIEQIRYGMDLGNIPEIKILFVLKEHSFFWDKFDFAAQKSFFFIKHSIFIKKNFYIQRKDLFLRTFASP